MNGYELVKATRGGLSRGLVLEFIANELVEEKPRCAEAALDACLFKPICLEILNARLA